LRGGTFVKLLFLRRYRAHGFDITPGFVRSFEQTLALAKWPGKFEPENKESPMTESTLDRCRTNEEAANSITHAVGMVLAMAATALLTILASIHGSTRAMVSGGIFGATLILLYTTSTLYHSARNPRSKTISQNPLPPCHLAPVCPGRQHPALLCHPVLRHCVTVPVSAARIVSAVENPFNKIKGTGLP
jgi:hypothetical protein